MATRAETFRAAEQRHRTKGAAKRLAEHESKKKRVKRALHAHDNVHAGKKAAYSLEPRSAKGRASRKSTRGGANHTRADVNLELRSERRLRAPDTRARGGK
jgi:hypothetical protein